MTIGGVYSFKDGQQHLDTKYPHLIQEIQQIVAAISAADHQTKVSKEKTMLGRMLFDPRALNKTFKRQFNERGWKPIRVVCEYSNDFYVQGYTGSRPSPGAFREMDFVKEQLGVEVQFGKYAFMVYNVCAKMTIFRNLLHIDAGVEIVPTKRFADDMSTGVSFFEQIVWDLEQRGIADIDVPAVILGIES